MDHGLLEEWDLSPDGLPVATADVVVLPVRVDGVSAVLKLGAHEHEHVALQRWHGNGAVQLLRADPRRRALLLEFAGSQDLFDAWDVEACETIAGLYQVLHRPPMPQLSWLSQVVAQRTEVLANLPRNAGIPPRLVEQAISLGRAFAADPQTDSALLHTDLHYGNVLLAERAPCLAISPKPINGDPCYEPAPLLWHRWDETYGHVRDAVRRRFQTICDVAELDPDRARDWAIVRSMHRAAALLHDKPSVTACIAIAKAVQD